jgi:ribosomal protein L37E
MSSGYRIHGIELSCKHCGSKSFTVLEARIGNRNKDLIDSTFGLPDERSAEAFTCTSCGFVHWFALARPVEELPDEVACLECGTVIPSEAAACPGCGWSWSSKRP